jgi:hypothetical protein
LILTIHNLHLFQLQTQAIYNVFAHTRTLRPIGGTMLIDITPILYINKNQEDLNFYRILFN